MLTSLEGAFEVTLEGEEEIPEDGEGGIWGREGHLLTLTMTDA